LELEGVNPAHVAEELKIETDHMPSREFLRTIEENGRTFSSWILDTHGRVLTNNLSDHLDWIAAKLMGKEDIFAKIVASATRAEIMVYGARTQWEIDADALRAFRARTGVPLTFCVTVIRPTTE